MTGLEMTQHCRYQDAITACRKGLLDDPTNEVAWLIIGDALSKLNKFPEAIDAYDNVLALTPKNASVHESGSGVSSTPAHLSVPRLIGEHAANMRAEIFETSPPVPSSPHTCSRSMPSRS